MVAVVVLAALLGASLAACGGSDPAGGDGPPAVQEPRSVQAALDGEPGSMTVEGFLVAPDGEPIRLCSALAESYPPQCGEPSLVVEGLDLDSVAGLVRAEEPDYAHTAWTDATVALSGDVADGVLRVQAS
jgi:hypothetical protein